MGLKAMEGIRVADFSWNAVGPLMGTYLAEHGATVVKVETATRLDITRSTPPYKDDIVAPDRAAVYPSINTSKYGVTINMNHPKGLEVARRLVAWADVLLESFTPGVMKRWGLSYEEVRQIRPDMIMLSTCNQGQTGPYARQPGFGTQLTALAGFTHLTGWPDRRPAHPHPPHTDFLAMRFGVIALLASLDYRRRTGRGQYLDLSQYESSLHLLAPLLLDYRVNGREAIRTGNRLPHAAPHNAYPCRGDDRWCAISVFTDQDWQALCRAMGEPAWSQDPRFSTLRGRKENEDELDPLIAVWTLQLPAEEVMARLQAAGVAAGVVQNGQDILNDPQLEYRHFYEDLEHPVLGRHHYHGPPFKLSRTPAQLRPGNILGQHNEYVFTQLLGMSDEEFVQLMAEGAFD